MRRTRLGAVFGGLLAASLATAGCGGSQDHAAGAATPQQASAVRPAEAISLAAASARQAGTAHVTGTMRMTLHGKQSAMGPITMQFAADEQWTPRVRVHAVMSGVQLPGMDDGRMQTVLTDKAMYLSMPLLTQQLGKKWVMFRFADAAKATGMDLGQLFDQARQMDPAQYLAVLQASGDIRDLGTEQVDGVPTTHYGGIVDMRKALAKSTGDLKAQLERGLDQVGMRTEHIDVWIDRDHQLRRTLVQAAGSAMSMRMDMHVSRYGESVHVSVPPAGETVNLAQLMSRGAKA